MKELTFVLDRVSTVVPDGRFTEWVAGRELRDLLQATQLSLGPQLTPPCGLADVSLRTKF